MRGFPRACTPLVPRFVYQWLLSYYYVVGPVLIIMSILEQDGMTFSDTKGTFHTVYETYRRGQAPQRQILDVIITGKVRPLSDWFSVR